MAQADSGNLLWEFVTAFHETDVDDPFFQWLRDDRPLEIDWGAFGIEKNYSESPD